MTNSSWLSISRLSWAPGYLGLFLSLENSKPLVFRARVREGSIWPGLGRWASGVLGPRLRSLGPFGGNKVVKGRSTSLCYVCKGFAEGLLRLLSRVTSMQP
jgi:hypothetical protein